MDDAICGSISAYTEISCSGEGTASAVALPVIQIGVVLIIIIALAVVGVVMKKYAKKVRAAVDAPMSKAVEKVEQDKLLNQDS
ncbi:hypothetical protein FWD20_03780 [Candidatus Saccharibacteria bacterium]|nr:hypothetical protein [Candidatus Saccharibacteria bacterium]